MSTRNPDDAEGVGVKVALIPALNEEKTIAKVIADAFDHVDEIIVCDDGSKDSTAKIAEAMGCRVARHETNLGKGGAMRTLFEEALKLKVDVAITIDGDGQHHANEIPKLLEKLKEGFDIVIGSREGMHGYRAIGNKILSGADLDSQSGFRAYNGSILASLIPSEMGMGVDSEILHKAIESHLSIGWVPISVDYSVPNPHKTNMVLHFLDVLSSSAKIYGIKHPMLLYGLPGFLLVFTSFLFAIGDLPRLMEQGLGWLAFEVAGILLLLMGVLIWTMNSMIRRIQK